jgi:tripartite ATP-independent transporter DctM subunit
MALATVAVAAACGAPVFALIGGCAIALLWSNSFPIAAMAVKHYSRATTPAIPTIPLFTLAGYFLAEGGAARRLVRLCQALVGYWRGGPVIVTAAACAFFTCFTGASGVTILALGGLLLPVLLATRYEGRAALGLVTGAGSLGLLFPPCLPLILYAVVASQALESLGSGVGAQYDVSIERMFIAGIGPGVLLVALTALWGWHKAPKRAATSMRRFDGREAVAALWDAKWELAMPVVALGALFGGWLTSPVQAAALTALYAFVVETLIYRDLRVGRDLVRVLRETGLLSGSVLVILGVALGLTNYLVTEQIPDRLIEWVTGATDSRLVFLLALNALLIVVGCLMDIYSAIVVVVPLIVPLAMHFGVDPVHLGIIFLANLELGFLTPPVGMNLFLAAYRFDKPFIEVIRASLPMVLVLLIGVLLITYWPRLTLWLPALLF